MKSGRVLSKDTINGCVLMAEYAVRGELAIESERLKSMLLQQEGVGNDRASPRNKERTRLPFKRVLPCNIGNPQALSQTPISFYRKVISLVECVDILLKKGQSAEERDLILSQIKGLYGDDVYTRVVEIKNGIGGASVGAYSHSQGILYIRNLVSRFIERRDGGIPSDPEHIFLTNGASSAIQMVLQMIVSSPSVGILIPSPQYPLYSATVCLLNGKPIFYPLNEDDQGVWSLSIPPILQEITEARARGVDVKAICVINPGNPTGNLASCDDLRQIIQLCHEHRLILLADEVYQSNIYPRTLADDPLPFHSAKKVLKEMGPKYDCVELFSFHSVSKGLLAECGKRGGYVECTNIDPEVRNQMYKLASIGLCSNIGGQLMVGLMADPPSPGGPSYGQFIQECTNISESLKRRAFELSNTLNRLRGVTCGPPQGALYLFPRYTFPERFLEEAKGRSSEPDALYAMLLLKETGIVTTTDP